MILPILLVLNCVDVLFCPGNISPIFCSKKKIQWIHTIGPFEKNFVSYFAFRERLILIVTKYLIISSCFTSDMVIFESNYTKDLFIRKFKQKIQKSAVIQSGNNVFFKPVKNNSQLLDELEFEDFIFTVSHLYPYKNIELLIESFYALRLYEKGFGILVAGSISDKKYYEKLKLLVDKYGISKYVIFLGRLEMKELRVLYSKCKIFVFTSPFENFAYTLIEAMSCSSPIITTNTTAMPESCGDAALYFSPNSKEELSSCIKTFLNDENLRLSYKKKSLLKSKEYPLYSSVNSMTNSLLHKII
tara:strand:- start:260 stop:1165 length:906 start_codon:yes stop_codon:yes gene_type:complete